MPSLRWDTIAVLFLVGLGLLHIPIQWMSSIAWDDSTSFRKPILFGISTGLTLGSLLLLLNDLQARSWDWLARVGLVLALVLEVLLITLQSWRGAPSHFNRSTILDTAIETSMLACILIAVSWILALTVRCLRPNAFRELSSARKFAQRAGMILLFLSCVLGIAITILGNYQILRGQSPEFLGNKGVLKFPHGAVLHAIQTLVLWAWLCEFFGSSCARWSVASLMGAHCFFLVYALRQTLLGRSRWDADLFGWGLLGCTILATVVAIVLVGWPNRR
jgi:hypothetical protein